MPIRCIAFDLDDTFWDCGKLIRGAESALYQWFEERCPRISQKYSLEGLVYERHRFFAQQTSLHHDLGQLRLLWLQQLLSNYQYDPEWAFEAFRVFFKARNQVEFFPKVLETLEQLGGHYQLGVITNGNADVEHIGMGHLFAFTHSAAEAKVCKPHITIFQQAIAKAGVSPEEMVYIGDDWEKDIQGASRAGLHTAWFNPEGKVPPPGNRPTITFGHFQELPALLSRIGINSE